MAFSDTVYSGPMLEGLNRAKLAYEDQATQRLRDEQTLRAALARVEAMNRQTDAGERNSQMEWGTRGRLGDNQNLIAASDAANRMELGRMGDSTARYTVDRRMAQSDNELGMQQYQAEQAAANRLKELEIINRNALELETLRGKNYLGALTVNPYGQNGKGLSEMMALDQEAQDKNALNQSLADIANRSVTPEAYNATTSWYWPDPTHAEFTRKTLNKAAAENPGAFMIQGGTNAVPVLRRSPLAELGQPQPAPQPGPMPAPRPASGVDRYIQQYGPTPTARIPGTSWGPNFVVGPNGQWMQRTQ